MNSYTVKTFETLNNLGFINLTHIIWYHKDKEVNITVPYQTKATDLHLFIMEAGKNSLREDLRELINIKNR